MAQYAENIMREATRRRLETYHRERWEMWGLKKVETPEKRDKGTDSSAGEGFELEYSSHLDTDEGSEGDDSDEDSDDDSDEDSDEEEGEEPETQVATEDQTDEAAFEDILKGVPKPSDPCFNNPPDIVFLPRVPEFNEVIFQLEYRRGYTRKQVIWLMGGPREGRGPVPTANAIGMRLKRYMKKNNLTDAVKVAPAGTAKKPTAKKPTAKPKDDDDEDEDSDDGVHKGPLLPHGPRIRNRELGVHGWFWKHPHEIEKDYSFGYG
ncbi:hypothetical protein HOY80DRAFT_988174 [Tuber brumale]|nr:hypothetical protein HOY80DRAFT_988174 [Tuber brumale]